MRIIYYNNQKKNTNVKISLINTALIITSPSCGHCEALKPILKDVNNKLRVYTDNGITKIYNIENEVFDKLITTNNIKRAVSGYPTILIIKNNKLFKIYNGSRTADDLINFFKVNLNIQPMQQIKRGGGTKKNILKNQKKPKRKYNYSRKQEKTTV